VTHLDPFQPLNPMKEEEGGGQRKVACVVNKNHGKETGDTGGTICNSE